MSRRLRLTLLIIGGLAATAVLVLLGLYLAAQHEPAFYHEAMHIDRAVLEKASDRMLRQTTALASAVKKRGHWEALFTAEQINGWLAVDLVRNHPNTLPAELHDPRVGINPKGITVACRFDQDGMTSVLSLTVEPYLPQPNVLALRIVERPGGPAARASGPGARSHIGSRPRHARAAGVAACRRRSRGHPLLAARR